MGCAASEIEGFFDDSEPVTASKPEALSIKKVKSVSKELLTSSIEKDRLGEVAVIME